MIRSISRNFAFLPREVVIVAAKRTPIGSFMGSLSTIPAPRLAAHSIRAALTQATLQPSDIQEVILGQIYSGAVGQSPARQAAIFSGLPESTICMSINKVCSSGLKSISLAAQNIALGVSDIIVAGGMENMSLAPFMLPNYRTGQLMGDGAILDSLTYDGLLCPFNKILMGGCNEETNKKYGITREQQDDYCIESYTKSTEAWERGFFNSEVEPLEVKIKKEVKTIDEDQEFRKVKMDKIRTLKPAFEQNGTITPANASSINDGACAVILMSAEKAKEKKIQPLARILSFADYELEPVHFGIAPTGAVPLALKRAGISQEKVDLFEINEAFSSVVLANIKILDLDPAKVNVNGGAVSLGHPVGMSGARILATLMYGLKDKGMSLGATGICNGGGGATAMVIENLN